MYNKYVILRDLGLDYDKTDTWSFRETIHENGPCQHNTINNYQLQYVNSYYFDIQSIIEKKSFFKKFKGFNVYSCKDNSRIELSFFGKLRIMRRLQFVLNTILTNLYKPATPIISSEPRIITDDMITSGSTTIIDSIDCDNSFLNLQPEYFNIDHPDMFDNREMIMRANEVMNNSITKDEIIARNKEAEDFKKNVAKEKEKIRKIIIKSRKKYENG